MMFPNFPNVGYMYPVPWRVNLPSIRSKAWRHRGGGAYIADWKDSTLKIGV